MKSLIPRYGAERMVMDYVRKFYSRAALQQERLAADNFAAAMSWRNGSNVGECWPQVRLQLLDQPKPSVRTGEQLTFCAAVHLGGLAVEDVVMECLVGSGATTDMSPVKRTASPRQIQTPRATRDSSSNRPQAFPV